MKKLTTVALAGAMVAASSFASASATRWTGFGDSSLFIGDIQDFQTLPQTVASNPNATYMEFGPQYDYSGNGGTNSGSDNSINTPWGGVDLAVGPGVLSIWGNRPYNVGDDLTFYDGRPSVFPTGWVPSTNFNRPTNQVDVIYGMNVSDKLTIGAGINFAGNSYTNQYAGNTFTTEHEDQTSGDFGITLGADLKELGPIDALQIGLQWNGAGAENIENNGTDNNKEDYTSSQVNLRVGADIKGEKGMFQRIELGLKMENGEIKSNPATAAPAHSWVDTKDNWLGWNLGWAMGMSGEKGMGLTGLILTGASWENTNPFEQGAYAGSKDTYDYSKLDLTLVSAGEAKVNSWLTSRAGISMNLWDAWSEKEDYTNSATASETDTYTWNDNQYGTKLTLGLSVNVGDITIDGALNQDLLFNGPFFTNGIPTQLFSQVSATWAWGAGKE
jgi:hypothetical protein